MKVLVLNADRTPLMPCWPDRAHHLIRTKRASLYRRVPETIILRKQIASPAIDPIELKIDSGSVTMGIALVANDTVIVAANLTHRGQAIRAKLATRRALRRARKTRYRVARFDNRTKPQGRLPPSLQSRVDNVASWATRLARLVPLSSIAIETVRFNMQKIRHPEISGVEYRQGELLGYEIRAYLLEKFDRTCVYCGVKNVPLQVEHITPRARGGSNRVSNLTPACEPCNTAKGTQRIGDFLAHDPKRLTTILARCKAPLRDAAAVNATRYAVGRALKSFGLAVSFWSGGRTKMNRAKQGYAKDHWIDAACVGATGARVTIHSKITALAVNYPGLKAGAF